jgi:bifunctional DNase/RNase
MEQPPNPSSHPETREVLLEVRGIILDPTSQVPIVILRAERQSLLLPIWIGVHEANAIAAALEGIEPPRPQTHDLAKNLLDLLGTSLTKVVISDLRESTFFAVMYLETPQGPRTLDARPSDAIALATRFKAPVYALEGLLEQARAEDRALGEQDEEDRLKKLLDELRPEDLGKYTM